MTTILKENEDNKKLIKSYELNLETYRQSYLNTKSVTEFKELFKGLIIMMLDHIILLYNKILQKKPELKFSKSSEKITKINTLVDCLKNNTKIMGCDVNEVILKGYVSYFYAKYRDMMMNWDIKKIKTIDESDIKGVVFGTVTNSQIMEIAQENFNIVPEVVLMINNLKEKEIFKLLYYLNNVNTMIDIYLYLLDKKKLKEN